jgi:excisionase family DNA binding protein
MLTPEEAGARCGIPARAILRLARARKIAAYHFGHRTVRFKPSDVAAFIENCKG